MTFRRFIESLDKAALIEKLKQTILDIYGSPIHPGALKNYLSKTPEELQQTIDWMEKEERPREKFRREQAVRDQQKQDAALHTRMNTYERLDPGHTFERIVCGEPNLHKTGMPMHPITNVIHDPELAGYFGVHCGDPNEWLPWMIDDGWCNGTIYIYSIVIPPSPVFYITEDPNAGSYAGEYGDKEVPAAQIIFSKINRIPPQYIKLLRTKRN